MEHIIKSHPSIVNPSALADLSCALKYIGITYFSHVHINQARKTSFISSCPKFLTAYLQQKFINDDTHILKLTEGKTHFILNDLLKVNDNTARLHKLFVAHNHDHAFSIIKVNKHYTDCYYFATTPDNISMNSRYFQIIDLLYLFINNFHDTVNKHKELKRAYQIYLPLQPENCPDNINLSIINTIIDKLKTNRLYINQLNYLTKRELECIHWLSFGKTTIDIADILQTTPRTVKEHIRNLKEKLNCQTLFQLGIAYNNLLNNSMLK